MESGYLRGRLGAAEHHVTVSRRDARCSGMPSLATATEANDVPRAHGASAVAQRVIGDRPLFHVTDRDTCYAPKGAPVRWNAQAQTLELIARDLSPEHTTLEIGSGASTVVFAATGARHTAISPFAAEHEQIASYCDSIGVSTARVAFVADSSDRVLPKLDPDDQFDLVFLDGTHAFPYAIVEWHYLRRHLPVGGLLIIDDVPVPAVGLLHRFLESDPGWEGIAIVDCRTAVFRKVAESVELTWPEQPFNDGYPQLAFLPPAQRAHAQVRHWRRAARNRLAGMPRLRAAYRRLTAGRTR